MDEQYQIELLNELIVDFTKDNKFINYDEINDIKKLIITTLTQIVDNPNMELINYNLNKKFKPIFTIDEDYDYKMIYKKKKFGDSKRISEIGRPCSIYC